MKNAMLRKPALLALSAATFLVMAGAAQAGECPANKKGVNLMKPGATEPKGVTDTVLSALNLGDQYAELAGRQLRMRRLVIEPGGVVPWHDHSDRPANIYIVEGTVTEYSSNCKVPIVHKAGEVAPELGNTSHWWKNTGDTPAVIISADLFRSGEKDHPM